MNSGVVDIIILLVHVDDILVTGNAPTLIQQFVTKLNSVFLLKDLGALHYFFGIQVTLTDNGLFLTQQKYITSFIDKASFSSCKATSTPMVTGGVLSKYKGTALDKETASTYKSLVGAMQYCCITRPELAFLVGRLCQLLSSPIDSHW